MSTHRGLPPPAAMSLPPQQMHSAVAPPPQAQQPPPPPPPSGTSHPSHSSHSSQPPPSQMGPPGHHHRDSWSVSSSAPLPPAPQHWQSSDESMRNWLLAKAEEEKTRQEEERTRQETLRLEQRRIEMDILRASLGGGIPPPMVPLVFAGMGGGNLPQAALEWAQQLVPQSSTHPQLMPPQRQSSVEPQREPPASQSIQGGQFPPNASQSGASYGPYGDSPTRPRGSTVSGVPGQQSTASASGGGASHSTYAPNQPYRSATSQSSQHDSNPSIYFHHWQPPATQASSSSNRPATPTADSQRKRKAGDTYHHSRASSRHRSRSPPTFTHVAEHPQAAAARKGHKRHKSDVSWYQPPRQGMGSSAAEPSQRSSTPMHDNSSVSSRDREATDDRKHPVSFMLSRERERAQIAPRDRYNPNSSSQHSQHGQHNSDGYYQHHHGSRLASPGTEPRKTEPMES